MGWYLKLQLRESPRMHQEFSENVSSPNVYPPLLLIALAPEIAAASGVPDTMLALVALVWHSAAVQVDEECCLDVWRITQLAGGQEEQVDEKSNRQDTTTAPTKASSSSHHTNKEKGQNDAWSALFDSFVLVLTYIQHNCPRILHFFKQPDPNTSLMCPTCGPMSIKLHTQGKLLFSPSMLADLSMKFLTNAMAWGKGADQDFNEDGESLFLLGAMLEHNCEPSATWTVKDWSRLTLRAIRDIHKGECISISYLPATISQEYQQKFPEHASLASSVSERQVHFQEQWGFSCSCQRCQREIAHKI